MVALRSRNPRAASRLSLGFLLLGLSTALAGCDNAICVFGPAGCFGDAQGTPGTLGAVAVLPDQDQVIQADRPTIIAAYPEVGGPFLAPTTPVAVVFSESMNLDTLEAGIELRFLDLGGFPGPTIATAKALVANGRVLILLPTIPLAPGDYQLLLNEDVEVRDLTGQLLDVDDPAAAFTTFAVDIPDPEEEDLPKLIGTYPPKGDVNDSPTGEFVMLFDRPMDVSTVTPASFFVTSNGDPVDSAVPALPLTIDTGFVPVVDPRGFTWNNVDSDDEVVSLGIGADILVTISPSSNPIEDLEGTPIPPTLVDFRTLEFSKPSDVLVLSTPEDAINIANLTPGADEISMGVGLDDAQVGDRVFMWIFGTDGTATENAPLVAVERRIDLPGPDTSSGTFTFDDLALTSSQSPLTPIFADGAIAVAVAVNRGASFSALRVLDVDTLEAGLQDLIQDTVRPEVLSIVGAEEDSSDFRSSYRGLSLAGTANEQLSSAEVSVPSLMLDNGSGNVIGSAPSGLFLARPVDFGALPSGATTVDYELQIYDQAGNAAEELTTGTFTQVGFVRPDPVVVGGTVDLRVFDAETLLPLEGALVLSNADDGATYPSLGQATTTSGGLASVPSHGAGQLGTIVTVSLAEYDVWTFQRITSRCFDVLLQPSVGVPPAVPVSAGAVTAATPAVAVLLQGLSRRVAESRQPDGLAAVGAGLGFPFPTVATQSCTGFPVAAACPFGPLQVLPGIVGAASAVVGNTLLLENQFGAASLIRAFDLNVPTDPLSGASAGAINLSIGPLLDDPATDPTDLPEELLTTRLLTAAVAGIDTANLVDDPAYTGAPSVTVEARVPGLGGPVAVGLGLAYVLAADDWRLRSAIPGAASPTGDLVTQGVIEPDLLLHAEIRDVDGNVAGTRARFVDVQMTGAPYIVFPGSVPQFLSPTDGGSTGTQAFTAQISDALPDALALGGYEGIFRVTLLQTTTSQRWTLWRPNSPDIDNPIDARFVDVTGAGGAGLADGLLLGTASEFAWVGFDPADFMWSDIRRDYDLYGHSAPINFTKP